MIQLGRPTPAENGELRVPTAIAINSSSSGRQWLSAVSVYLLALALLLAIDALALRTPFYRQYLEPESYAGTVEQMLARVEQARWAKSKSRVIVLGDSRMAEGFSAKVARARVGGNSVVFVNAAVPGSTPRCWSYFVRWMPSDVLRGATVVIPMDDYADEDGAWDWADRSLDTSILGARLALRDVPEYASSFRSVAGKLQAGAVGTLRGSALRQDLQAFLASPAHRIEKVNAIRAHGLEWTDNYSGNTADLRGLEVDWGNHNVTFPPSLAVPQREALRAMFFRKKLPQTGRYREYRLRWFRSIVSHLRSSGANAIFIRVPRAPVALPGLVPAPNSAVSEMAREPGVTIAPPEQFSGMERPDCFFDGLHLNSVGREEFSLSLVDYLAAMGAISKEEL